MTRFDDRVALITGAGSGIGAATAARLASEGAIVVCADIDVDAAQATAEAVSDVGGSATALALDVRTERSCADVVAAVVGAHGRVDVLVNSAGLVRYGTVTEISLDDWALQLDVNLRGAFLMCRHALPLLEANGGAIVNVASAQAFASQQLVAPYAASKAGLVALTRTIALDHADRGVRANTVCPGTVQTAMLDYAAGLFSPQDPDAAKQTWGANHPLGRVIAPEEVAAAIAFLASDDASAITGASLLVDGGLTARLAT